MKYTILVCYDVNEENVANVLKIMKAKSLYILGWADSDKVIIARVIMVTESMIIDLVNF